MKNDKYKYLEIERWETFRKKHVFYSFSWSYKTPTVYSVLRDRGFEQADSIDISCTNEKPKEILKNIIENSESIKSKLETATNLVYHIYVTSQSHRYLDIYIK